MWILGGGGFLAGLEDPSFRGLFAGSLLPFGARNIGVFGSSFCHAAIAEHLTRRAILEI